MAIQQMFFRNALVGGNWSPEGTIVDTITSVSSSDASVTITIPAGRTIPYGNVVMIVYSDMALVPGDIDDTGNNTWDILSNPNPPARVGVLWSQLTTSLFPGNTILLPPVDDGVGTSQTRMIAVYEFSVPSGFVVSRDGYSIDSNTGAAPAAAEIEGVSEERLFLRMLYGAGTAGNGTPTTGWTEMTDTRHVGAGRHLYVEFIDNVGSITSQPTLSSATSYNSLMVGFKLTDPSITPTPTPTPSVTPSITPSNATPTPTPTTTVTPSVTASPTPSITPSVTPTISHSPTPTPSPSALPMGPGTYAYVADTNTDHVTVIDTSTNTVYATFNVGDQPTDLAVHQSLDKVYVANFGSDNISVIDTVYNTVAATITVGNAPTRLQFNPDYSKLYVANKLAGTISVIDTASDTVTSTITLDVGIDAMVMNSAGTKLYVGNTSTDEVKTVQLSDNSIIGTRTYTTLSDGLALTSDESKVLVVDSGLIKYIVTSTGADAGSSLGAPGGSGFQRILGVDSSNNFYAVEGTNLVISTGLTGANYTQLSMGTSGLREVVFTADGSYAYVTLGNSTVKVINTATKAVTATITAESGTAGIDIVYLVTPTPTPTSTPTPTPTISVTPSTSVTPTPTPTPSSSEVPPTPSPTPTPTPSSSEVPPTPSPSATTTPTPTPSITPSPSATVVYPAPQSTGYQTTSDTVTTLVVNKPTSLAEGDMVVLHVYANDARNGGITIPSGFIRIAYAGHSGNFNVSGAYYKIATASEPSTYTVQVLGLSGSTTAVAAYRITGANAVANAQTITSSGSFASYTGTAGRTLINLFGGGGGSDVTTATVSGATTTYTYSATSGYLKAVSQQITSSGSKTVTATGYTTTSTVGIQFEVYQSAGVVEITPSEMSGIFAWYDFSDPSMMSTSTVGATVQTCADKSGGGRNLTTPASGNRPILRQAGNSIYYLEFDGTDDYMTLNGGSTTVFNFLHSTNAVGYTVIVSAWAEATSNRDVFLSTNNSSSTNVGWAFWNEASPTAGIRNACTYVSGSQQVATSTSGSKHGGNVVATVRRNSADRAVNVYVNGTSEANYTATTTTNTNAANRTLHIGAHAVSTPVDYFDGRIYQIAIFNRTLSDSERLSIEAYLNSRLGN